MPFSDVTLKNSLTHTVWYLPSVAACFAMGNLLQSASNKFFHDYEVIVCAGTKAGIGVDALPPVKAKMGDPLKTKTITLSCGKLMTGVTVRPWTGIFMLCNLKSPETYFQSAFRVQSPWTTVNDEGKTEIIKEECYIFDFALNRALRQISDYSCRLNTNEVNPESKVGEFMKFLPVLAFDGASMNIISAQDVLDITYAGTSATLLAKRWQTALLVHVDNDTLKRLQDNPEALDALMKIEGFRSLNQEIETIINRSEAIKKAKKEDDGKKDKKEKKEISEEEKKIKSLRKQVQENLLKLAARIPSFMYLTDFREQTIKDVITQLEPDLFRKVTGLTVKDFDILCEIGLFDPEKMNQGIFGFRRYENSSLNYTGINMHEGESIGGWDTVLRRDEFDALYASQQASMTDFVDIIVPEEIRIEKSKHAEPIKKAAAKPVSVVTPGTVKAEPVTPVVPVTPIKEEPKIDWEEILKDVGIGTEVEHSRFGLGTVESIYSNNKYVRVKFALGEKSFEFPKAFINGFLKLSNQ